MRVFALLSLSIWGTFTGLASPGLIKGPSLIRDCLSLRGTLFRLIYSEGIWNIKILMSLIFANSTFSNKRLWSHCYFECIFIKPWSCRVSPSCLWPTSSPMSRESPRQASESQWTFSVRKGRTHFFNSNKSVDMLSGAFKKKPPEK